LTEANSYVILPYNMKTVTACLNCKKLRRISDTYKAQAEITTIVPLTGERKKEVVIGRLCGQCAYEAGYKVRKELLDSGEKGGD